MGADAVAGELDRHGFDHGNQAALGGGVMLAPWRRFDGGERGRADQHAAIAALHHVPGGGAKGVERAIEVDAHDAIPLLGRHIHKGSLPTAADAGIGKAAIDAPEGGNRLGEAGLHGRFVADVAFERQNPPAGFFKLGLGGGVLSGVGAPDSDIRAGLRGGPRDAEADAAIAAGNQGDFAGEVERLIGQGAAPMS